MIALLILLLILLYLNSLYFTQSSEEFSGYNISKPPYLKCTSCSTMFGCVNKPYNGISSKFMNTCQLCGNSTCTCTNCNCKVCNCVNCDCKTCPCAQCSSKIKVNAKMSGKVRECKALL